MSIFGSSEKKDTLENFTFPSSNINSANRSFFSEDLEIQGEITGKDYIEISGKIVGKVQSKKIDIRSSGSIQGEITSDTLTVEGNIDGEINAHDLYIKSTSKIKGIIKYKNIDIENGAIITAELIKTI